MSTRIRIERLFGVSSERKKEKSFSRVASLCAKQSELIESRKKKLSELMKTNGELLKQRSSKDIEVLSGYFKHDFKSYSDEASSLCSSIENDLGREVRIMREMSANEREYCRYMCILNTQLHCFNRLSESCDRLETFNRILRGCFITYLPAKRAPLAESEDFDDIGRWDDDIDTSPSTSLRVMSSEVNSHCRRGKHVSFDLS